MMVYWSFLFWLIIGSAVLFCQGLFWKPRAAGAGWKAVYGLYQLQFQIQSTPPCLAVATGAVDLINLLFFFLLLNNQGDQTRST